MSKPRNVSNKSRRLQICLVLIFKNVSIFVHIDNRLEFGVAVIKKNMSVVVYKFNCTFRKLFVTIGHLI